MLTNLFTLYTEWNSGYFDSVFTGFGHKWKQVLVIYLSCLFSSSLVTYLELLPSTSKSYASPMMTDLELPLSVNQA